MLRFCISIRLNVDDSPRVRQEVIAIQWQSAWGVVSLLYILNHRLSSRYPLKTNDRHFGQVCVFLGRNAYIKGSIRCCAHLIHFFSRLSKLLFLLIPSTAISQQLFSYISITLFVNNISLDTAFSNTRGEFCWSQFSLNVPWVWPINRLVVRVWSNVYLRNDL